MGIIQQLPWFIIGEFYLLVIGFLCYAALKPIWKQLPLAAQIILSPLAAFYPVDILCRFTIGWLYFWQAPSLKDYTITYLCNSHVLDAEDTYKRRTARWICRILNIIQHGHCPCMDQVKD